jgi:hypothetical protein
LDGRVQQLAARPDRRLLVLAANWASRLRAVTALFVLNCGAVIPQFEVQRIPATIIGFQ